MGKRFSDEYRSEAVKLVIEQGLSPARAAQDLGIGVSTVDRWVRLHQERQKDLEALSETELAELKRLRQENLTLRIERDLLKKATVFFAKSST
jgi:transposase